MEEEQKEGSLKDEIRRIREKLEDSEKPKAKIKPFKIPGKGKISKAKEKKNWVTVMFVKENGDVDFRRDQIFEQTTMVDGCPRIATTDCVLRYKGKPIVIQPSWSVKPFSPAENYTETENQKLNTKGYRLLLNRMQTEAIKAKGNMNWILILIGLAVAGVAVYALFFGK